VNLENLSRHLVEFQKQKYDEVEIPGQYLWNRDTVDNKDFVKIERFLPSIDIVRKVLFHFLFLFLQLCKQGRLKKKKEEEENQPPN